MATIAELVRRNFAARKKRAVDETRRANPLDRELPFMLHIDGKIRIDPLLGDALKKKFPQGPHLVQAFSSGFFLGKRFFRVFLCSEDKGAQSYLWIIQDGQDFSVRWFVEFDKVYPGSEDEWGFWISKIDGSIGLDVFETKPEAGQETGVAYNRMWQPGKRYVFPVPYSEIVYPDRYA
jgi:hypothetical protein